MKDVHWKVFEGVWAGFCRKIDEMAFLEGLLEDLGELDDGVRAKVIRKVKRSV